jgi:hypothetical protein
MIFEAIFLSFLKEVGSTESKVQQLLWALFPRCCFSKFIQLYRLWHGNRGRFWWDIFCSVSAFSLGWKCIVAADKSFLKLIETLSLSVWVSPHWGFPWHLPKILCYSWVIECCSLCLFPLHICLAMCISAYGNF